MVAGNDYFLSTESRRFTQMTFRDFLDRFGYLVPICVNRRQSVDEKGISAENRKAQRIYETHHH